MVSWLANNEEEIPEYRYYSPNEADSIYSHFARVKDEKTLLKFASEFGLFGMKERRDIPIHLIGIKPGVYESAEEDSVEEMLSLAKEVRHVLHHWGNLQKGIPIEKEFTLPLFEEVWPEYYDRFKNADEKTLTKGYLAMKISRRMAGVRPVANFTAEGKPVPGYAYISLYDAMWHQLYQAIVEEWKFKECPFCHTWHAGQGRFCPPPPGKKRSLCENAFNQREYRKRRSN
jgi:hypothetical protein